MSAAAEECEVREGHLQTMKDGGVECDEGRLRCFVSELWLRGWRRQKRAQVAAGEAEERRHDEKGGKAAVYGLVDWTTVARRRSGGRRRG